ncbi:MAG: hypothetical protein R3E32_04860 [Chitinophagales bacterium]
MTLIYQTQTEDVLEIEEKLEELSLAFKTEQVANTELPTLLEGENVIEGKEAIFIYLEELKGELFKSYYCS